LQYPILVAVELTLVPACPKQARIYCMKHLPDSKLNLSKKVILYPV